MAKPVLYTPAVSADEVGSVASGSTLGLEQQLLAAQGQVGKTVLAVGYTYHQTSEGPSLDHKAQISSLGAGNVVFVYANGDDFNAGIEQEGPIFLSLGEVYVIQNVQPGTIITATEGAYGFSQQRDGNNESPMPLLSLALAFTDTFFFGFRNSTNTDAYVHIVNGPIASRVTIRTGAGAVVLGQEDSEVAPWAYAFLNLDGNQEYRIQSSSPIMACTNANMNNSKNGGAPAFYDSRLILPTANDLMGWPRSGFFSAPYTGTGMQYYVNDGAAWNVGSGALITLNPGSPVDADAAQPAGTGANDADYEPRGATRCLVGGLASAYSGADSSGLEATPFCPVSTFTQRVSLPLAIRNSGDGGNNGIAIAATSPGTARLYQWNPVTGVAELVTLDDPTGTPTTEISIERRTGSAVATPEDQLFPASAAISRDDGTGGIDPDTYGFQGDFLGGYIESDVPCAVYFNSEQNQNSAVGVTFRGTSGSAVVGIHSDDDEQLTYGITPADIRAEITLGTDGLLYRRSIGAGGVETWEVA